VLHLYSQNLGEDAEIEQHSVVVELAVQAD
jgi:hypothetical protein